MAFEDTRRLVEEQRKSLIATEEGLLEARDARDTLTADIRNARRRLDRKKTSDFFPTRLAQSLIKTMKSGKPSIVSQLLITEIDRAIETNEEFGRDEYKSALYSVATSTDIFKMIPIGAGWNLNISPQIVFEEEAGSLNDWAKGITGFRQELKTKIGPEGTSGGRKATQWWLDHVYRESLETKTFHSRLAISARKAPFWSILNSGSQPLASDRPDESYNPVPAEPTDFIGDAQRAIRAEFRELFNPQKELWFEEIKQLEAEIQEAVQLRDSFSEDIRNLVPDVKITQRVLASLGKKAKNVDKRKLANAIQKYRAGEEFETPQIELTRSGSKNRVRLSLKKFQGLVDY